MQRINNAAARLSLAALLVLVLSGLLVAQVSAHARFKSSDPAPNAVLNTPPTTISTTFEEETSPAQTTYTVYITRAGGTLVKLADGKVDDNDRTIVRATLPPLNAADGVYTVNWKTFTEDDGGVAQGNYSFTVQTGTAPAGATSATEPATNAGTSDSNSPGSTTGNTPNLPTTGAGNTLPLLWLLATVILAVGLLLRKLTPLRTED